MDLDLQELIKSINNTEIEVINYLKDHTKFNIKELNIGDGSDFDVAITHVFYEVSTKHLQSFIDESTTIQEIVNKFKDKCIDYFYEMEKQLLNKY